MKMFSCQKELPRLAVPALKDTCKKLLEWAELLQTEQEQAKTKHLVDEFLLTGGEGEALQNKLISWQEKEAIANWSAPVWRDLYLSSRNPLPINSNVFYYLKSKLNEKVHSQAHIAASLIASVYHFITFIDTQTLTVDKQKETPLCMNQYLNLFSSIRIPCQGTDTFNLSTCRKHIILLCNQKIYKLEVIDKKGDVKSPSELECNIDLILSDSKTGQNFGLMTTLPRGVWANARTELLQISKHNEDGLQDIEDSAFALCLDHQSPEEIVDISKQLLHGAGQDRFFDKTLQFVVFKNGKTGINFEHTSVDGAVMSRLITHIYDTIDNINFNKDSEIPAGSCPTPALSEITFELNHSLNQTLDAAPSAFSHHIESTQTQVLNFTAFGKNEIKQLGVSPDAFVQLAMLLAEYKLYGKCYSAYEAIMTRTFIDGRIDVLYTVTPESITFVQQFGSADISVQTKQQALIAATKKHIERAKECRSGQGVYTHLLALQYCYKSFNQSMQLESLPEIFTDSGYRTLTQSIVCTSTTSDYGIRLAGYGPIVENGYGIRYFTRNDSISFNMTSRTIQKDKLELMKSYIEESLLEMAKLMTKA